MQVNPLVRIFFTKTGRAKYISHLDTMRTLTRAFVRSGLPVWYTQGFNPHLYMTFALPISLGYESTCESLDVRFTEEIPFEEIAQKLNAAFPPGFAVSQVAFPVMKSNEIAWADYEVHLVYEAQDLAKLKIDLNQFMEQPTIEVSKRTKKGEKTMDIRPLCELLAVEEQEDRLVIQLRLAAGNTVNINPNLYLDAFYEWSASQPDQVAVKRKAIYNQNMQKFA